MGNSAGAVDWETDMKCSCVYQGEVRHLTDPFCDLHGVNSVSAFDKDFDTHWVAFPGEEIVGTGDLTIEVRRGMSCLVQVRLPAGLVKSFGATTVPLPVETKP
jgi:hypothetical protein